MINIQIEKLNSCLEEMKPFLIKHYEEVAMYKEHIKLNPDYDTYFRLEESGDLVVVIAREEGKLVGYFLSFVMRHPHYKDHLFASNDIIYVDPDNRDFGIGPSMISFAEGCLKERGVSVMVINMKTAKPFEGLCQSLGMDRAEYTYTKYIGD